jgi:hypothetical protein
MSVIDDILQSYIDQEITDITNLTPEPSPELSPEPSPVSSQEPIIPLTASIIPIESIKVPPTHIEELIKQNKMQLDRILKLEKSQITINQLQNEIIELKSQVQTLKTQPSPTSLLTSSTQLPIASTQLPASLPSSSIPQYTNYSQPEQSQQSRNKIFDFIPSIVQSKKHLVPTYCGRPIEDHRRFVNDLCGKSGCLRCNLDNLIKAGYSIHQLNEVRKQISKLSTEKSSQLHIN